MAGYPILNIPTGDLGAGGAEVTLESYLLSLLPILLMDGTLNESDIANLGSAGSALDGTPTDITIDANGMDFNGTTSVIQIPTHASINQLETQSWAFLAQRDNLGEGNTGSYAVFGAGVSVIAGFGGNRLYCTFNFSVTDPETFTDADEIPGTGLEWLFIDYDDAGDKIIHVYKGVSGTLTELACASPTAGSGTHIEEVGDLYIGNNSGGTGTFDGKIKKVLCRGTLLSTAEKLQLIDLAGV